jgi:antitoxin (DNA-binding transcriptional repressor) of toxin-antitoxin stability system
MLIQLSELKANPAKYFDLAKTVDVVVTRHGQRIGRIVCEEKAAQTERQRAIEAFFDMVSSPSCPDDTVYDPIKEERLREKGLLK